jgi:hypothetical protein
MITQRRLNIIGDAIYNIPELHGCRIGVYGNNVCQCVREGIRLSLNYGIVIIIEEVDDEASTTVALPIPVPPRTAPEAARILNGSRVGAELTGAVLSCGFAVVSGIEVVGGVAGAPETLGASLLITVAAWTGFITGAIQCGNGIVRSYEAIAYPHADSLQRLDDSTDSFFLGLSYSQVSYFVDALGIASGAYQMQQRIAGLLLRRGALQATGQAARSSEEILSGLERMTRTERQTAIREAILRLGRDAEGRRLLEQMLRESGELTEQQIRNLINYGTATIRGGSMVRTAMSISETVGRRLEEEIIRQLATRDTAMFLGGVALSATPSSLTGSGSGSVNTTANWILNIFNN